MASLVYILTFPGGKSYIGISTRGLARRLTLHRWHARNGREGMLYRAMRKYGEGGYGVIMTPAERAWMRMWRLGVSTPGRPAGWHHTEDAKLKMAAASRGAIFTEERRAKIGATKVGNKYGVGRIFSEASRAKSSASQKGKTLTEGHITKLSASHKGVPWSPARRAAQQARLSRGVDTSS